MAIRAADGKMLRGNLRGIGSKKVKRGILSVRVVKRMNACSPATMSAKVVQAQGIGKGNPVFFKFLCLFNDH